MAANTTVSSTIVYLNFVTRELNRYIPLPLLILGTIGNILNVLVFSRPPLRTNPCSLYFISGSIINFLSLYTGLLTPFLGLYNLDPTQKSPLLCKLRFYLRYTSITLSTWFILFACSDRLLSSSPNINFRLWSSLQLAKRTILLASMIGFLVPYTQIFYCYSINQKNTCTQTDNICRLTNNIILLVCNSGVPPILMVFISILTIRNVRDLNPVNSRRRRDIQLSRILLIQVIVVVSCAIPITAQKIYHSMTMFRTKNDLTTAIDSLISQISTEISYISSSTTFSIYSLTSKTFRREVSRIFSFALTCPWYKTNIVQPITIKLKSSSNGTMARNEHQLNRSKIIIDNTRVN